MAVQFDTTVRNAVADAVETAVGASPVLELRDGAKPANCAAADSGTLLASINVPSDWLTAASSGVKSKQGTWTTQAVADGTLGHFRLKTSGGSVRAQGSITLSGGGGEMIANDLDLVIDQYVSVNSLTLTAGNS